MHAIGIDIAQDTLDIVEPGRRGRTVKHTPATITQLVAQWARRGDARVALEATGGLERPLVRALRDAGVEVIVANPRQVRAYALGLGRLAKTDRVDARVLQEYALHASPRPGPTPAEERLATLQARREQLQEMRTAEMKRLKQTRDPWVARELEAHIAELDRRLMELEAERQRTIAADPKLAAKSEFLQGFTGIAQVNAAALCGLLPELGRLDRRALAHLAGVAPMSQESGRSRGRRPIRGGRPRVRTVLFLITWTAITWDPHWRTVYQGYLARGKPKMVALIAVARRYLVVLNARVRDWWRAHPEFAPT